MRKSLGLLSAAAVISFLFSPPAGAVAITIEEGAVVNSGFGVIRVGTSKTELVATIRQPGDFQGTTVSPFFVPPRSDNGRIFVTFFPDAPGNFTQTVLITGT